MTSTGTVPARCVTLGIDLAAQRSNTAMCAIEWTGAAAVLRLLAVGTHDGTELHDKFLISSIRGLRLDFDDVPILKTGIDAPFGWPDDFVQELNSHHTGRGWTSGTDNKLERFRWRRTDDFVRKHWDSQHRRTPLSVSADKIAMVAMRCAVILADLADHHGPEAADRTGLGMVCEVYPSPALRYWTEGHEHSLAPRESYRRKPASERRRQLATIIQQRLPLEDPNDLLWRCAERDDALNALVCALIARAALLDLTVPSPVGDERICLEGWIHLPDAPLDRLRAG